jgi:polyprenyl P-hydroxybenzoate/phenylacrylic acid decarboxylase-like protein
VNDRQVGQGGAGSRVVVAITGASGAGYGVALLRLLRQLRVETHLIVSKSGWLTLRQELDLDQRAVMAMADVHHDINNVGASLASGSFRHAGMLVAPCSMRTLAAIALGLNDNLISRAADVSLKERRRLVLLTRETPLTLAHLRNMTYAAEMGAVIMPPVPAFYARPQSVAEIVDYTAHRALDQLGLLDDAAYARWQGMGAQRSSGTGPG